MGVLENLGYGFSVALQLGNLLAVSVGVLVGTAIGVLPGIGPAATIGILLPFSITLGPTQSLLMLCGIFYGSMYGGSITSILVNVPGESTAVVTGVEGYLMTKKGRAGAALLVAAVGSCIAGTVGVVGLMLFAPLLAQVSLAFGPPEFFTLALLGLFALSRVKGGSLWKCILALGIGLMLATVGMDPVTGIGRYTFGSYHLLQGIELVPVIMGLFGVSELLFVIEKAGGLPHITGIRMRDLLLTREEWCRSWPAILRGTGIGFGWGLIPGPGVIISTFASYNLEKRVSKHRHEFGTGAIEGVAGPESANNAASSSSLVPMLSLGIPFTPSLALMLAALMMHGITPGPLLISQHPDIFWGLVASMYIGNVLLLILNAPLVGIWISLLRIPQALLLALIMILCLVGSYTVNNSTLDLFVMLGMGIIGYIFRKLDFDIAPIVMAVILGPMVEQNFRASLAMSGGNPSIFFLRPVSIVFLCAIFAIMLVPPIWKHVIKH